MKVPRYTVTPRAISEDIVTQDMGHEVLVYNLKTHRAMSLNSTVACVWGLCDGSRTFSAIRESVAKKLNTDVSEEVIVLALNELHKNDLLIKDDQNTVSQPLNDVSRREMIRKVGTATAVAIPVILAITAPKAIQAASGGNTLLQNGQPCVDDTQCQSTCCYSGGFTCQEVAFCFGP